MTPEQIQIVLPPMSLAQVNVIITALVERPYREVADILNTVRSAAATQAQEALEVQQLETLDRHD